MGNKVFSATTLLEHGVDFESDAIETLAYNANSRQLFIEFNSGDTGYIYNNVSETEFRTFRNADSLGRYFRNHFSKGRRASEYADRAVLNVAARSQVAATPQTFLDRPTKTVQLSGPAKSRFAVRWATTNGVVGGTPEFQATDEADALRQFNAAIESAAALDDKFKSVKIESVTHYLV